MTFFQAFSSCAVGCTEAHKSQMSPTQKTIPTFLQAWGSRSWAHAYPPNLPAHQLSRKVTRWPRVPIRPTCLHCMAPTLPHLTSPFFQQQLSLLSSHWALIDFCSSIILHLSHFNHFTQLGYNTESKCNSQNLISTSSPGDRLSCVIHAQIFSLRSVS